MNSLENKALLLMLTLVGVQVPVFAPPLAAAAGLETPGLEVHVMDRDSGRPLAGAAVCLGTQARAAQFGAVQTDARGVSRFEDLPRNPLVLTVSRQGYRGDRRLLEPLHENRVLMLKLAAGGGGPRCEGAGSDGEAAEAVGLEITELVVSADRSSKDTRQVLVTTRLSGSATDIMVSEHAGFKDASWQPYAASVGYQVSEGRGRKTLYVQVRRYVKVNGATLQTVSPVRTAEYWLR